MPVIVAYKQDDSNKAAIAREFALAQHGDQEHGSLQIINHLDAVVAMVGAHAPSYWSREDLDDARTAAYLHDIVEDTPVTLAQVEDVFGPHVRRLVDAVTDMPGDNRYERHLGTYYRIRDLGEQATLIKLCDRWHNQARSIVFSERYLTMYRGEYLYFKMALWRPDEHVRLWEVLDSQYEIMCEDFDGAGLPKGKQVAESAGASGTANGAEQGAGGSA